MVTSPYPHLVFPRTALCFGLRSWHSYFREPCPGLRPWHSLSGTGAETRRLRGWHVHLLPTCPFGTLVTREGLTVFCFSRDGPCWWVFSDLSTQILLWSLSEVQTGRMSTVAHSSFPSALNYANCSKGLWITVKYLSALSLSETYSQNWKTVLPRHLQSPVKAIRH